ncbi:MAG: SelB C-terminal domain-containing protein, partial [Verrucomicrobiota bacterium]
RRGQAVVIQPEGKTTRLRGLQSHNQDVEQVWPGTRTALSLPDLAVAGHGQEGIKRGDIVTVPELGSPTRTIDVLLEKSSRLAGAETGAARPLKDSALVRWHHGSANCAARVLLAEGAQLEPGQSVLAQLRFEQPVFALAGDRFILRDWSEQWTLAGGLVLDPEGDRKRFRSPAQQTFLKRCSQSIHEALTWVDAQLARDGVVRRPALLVKSHFGAAEISEAVRGLAAEGKAVATGELLAHAGWWNRLRQQAAQAIDARHGAHPEQAGLSLNDLRSALEASLILPEVFEALLTDLCGQEFQQVNAVIRRRTHRPALPPQFQAAGAKLRAALSAKLFEPPSRKDLAPDAVSQKALRFLLETGEAVEISDEVVLMAESFARATEAIKKFLLDHGSATVSELRQAVGASRRIVVPLLEKLDREGVTRREGDQRVLRGKG